ncbi:ATP-binding protein [Actinomadura soli]|uniref:ATP-binding protein n=1 Tax=Actinomadura soli TaxID=2508997 RepID=A0A5C4JFG0_9ACTN|nr:ATP-binding protein [Actinomadura soli]TMR03106.1 ATP-binding protein [Actinomadura soli]
MGINALNSGELDMSLLAACTAPGMMRALMELRLREWGMAGNADDLYLVASELITNAVRSTPDLEIRVRLVREIGAVVLGVWDSSDAMPAVGPLVELSLDDIVPDARALDAGHDAGTGGRGLPIVQALSMECSVTKTEPYGKWVWAKVAV